MGMAVISSNNGIIISSGPIIAIQVTPGGAGPRGIGTIGDTGVGGGK